MAPDANVSGTAVGLSEDRWLSQIFGHLVFRLHGDICAAGAAAIRGRLTESVDRQRRAMYYAKVATDGIDVVRVLTDAGFCVVDTNVTFGGASEVLAARLLSTENDDRTIREAGAEDREAALAIAGTCFRYSRFHLDPLVPLEIANRIKREWVRSYIKKQRGERLFVALEQGRPAGFLAVLASAATARPVRVIDLIGVDRAYQGQGIGRALVTFFVRRYARECEYMQIGTQAANLPSLHLYQSLGFDIVSTQYVLHMHTGSRPARRSAV